jgi:hypothetical protein
MLNMFLSKHNLEAIYFTYILPLLEYACELWDGCTQQENNKIEHIQHEAARIINGLPKFANCKHFRFAQRVIDSRINTKVHCYFEFCKTYLIFFFFDESEVVPIQFLVSSFKKSLINDVNLLKPSRYYSYGCRVLNVLHTRLRHRSSNLNADLFRVNLKKKHFYFFPQNVKHP